MQNFIQYIGTIFWNVSPTLLFVNVQYFHLLYLDCDVPEEVTELEKIEQIKFKEAMWDVFLKVMMG